MSSSLQTGTPTCGDAGQEGIALFVSNITNLNNGGMEQVADFLQSQGPETRARFIERCASLISSVAERDEPKAF